MVAESEHLMGGRLRERCYEESEGWVQWCANWVPQIDRNGGSKERRCCASDGIDAAAGEWIGEGGSRVSILQGQPHLMHVRSMVDEITPAQDSGDQ